MKKFMMILSLIISSNAMGGVKDLNKLILETESTQKELETALQTMTSESKIALKKITPEQPITVAEINITLRPDKNSP